MLNSISLFLGLRYTLARRRSRSVSFISSIAMVGIVLGVALLIVVLSVMNGFDRELRERILSIMPQVTLYHARGIEQWRPLREQLLENNNINAVAPFVELQGMANFGKTTEPLLIYGIDAEFEPSVSIIHRFLQQDSLQALSTSHDSIILGYQLAAKLKVVKNDNINIIIPRAEGQQQPPAVRRLRISDIFKTNTELDSSLALMNIQAAANLSSAPNVISGLHIKAYDLFASSLVAQQLSSQLPYGFYSTDWTRTHGNIYYAIKMSKNLVGLLLLLIIAIAAFNVVSTLVMVVIDKHTDIAILRTLGLTRRQIMSVFMVQGSFIGLIGTVIGVVLGLLLANSVQYIVAFIESLFNVNFLKTDIYPISYLPSQILWSDVLMIVSISLLMCLLATIYPAWRASSVKPAEALRYD